MIENRNVIIRIFIIVTIILIVTPLIYSQIGIIRTSGTPQIISCSPSFAEGFSQTDISVRVKNIGDGSGNFRFSYRCGDGEVEYSWDSHRYFDSGEEKTETIEVSGIEGKTEKCYIYVSDANSGYENEVSCDITLKTKKCEYCYNEGIKCNYEKGYLEKCADNNCEMEIVEYCSKGCGWNKYDSKYSCKEDIPKPNYWSYFIIILVIVLISVWIMLNKKRKRK